MDQNSCSLSKGQQVLHQTWIWDIDCIQVANHMSEGPSWLWNAGKTLPEVQNRDISSPTNKTRLHSSRMRTAHLLPVSPSMHCTGGGSGPGGCLISGGVWSQEGCLPLVRGDAWSWGGACLRSVGGVYPSMQWGRPTPPGQNSWHTLLKILPCPNFVADGNNFASVRESMCVKMMTLLPDDVIISHSIDVTRCQDVGCFIELNLQIWEYKLCEWNSSCSLNQYTLKRRILVLKVMATWK